VPDELVIMGVDASLSGTGVGFVRTDGDRFELLHNELIRTSAKEPLHERLKNIYLAIIRLIEEFKPDILSLEDIFYSRNVKVAVSLGQARGVIMLACAQRDVELAEFSAREIKQALTGNGGASKEQVSYMVKGILGVDAEFKSLDISDSLAAAICAGFKIGSQVSG